MLFLVSNYFNVIKYTGLVLTVQNGMIHLVHEWKLILMKTFVLSYNKYNLQQMELIFQWHIQYYDNL